MIDAQPPYYGYRHYNPILGRWISRDPIGEMAGVNLMSFVANAPIDSIDILGEKLQAYRLNPIQYTYLPPVWDPKSGQRIPVEGLYRRNWPVWIALRIPDPWDSGKERVKIKGQASGTPFVNSAIQDTERRQAVADHEMRHGEIDKTWWEVVRINVDGWDLERTWCKPCGQYAERLANAAVRY